MEERISGILAKMTLDQKIQLLAGADQWHTHELDRPRIPVLKVSDGPNGVRGEGGDTRVVTSASFPVGTAMGATWNPDLIQEVGHALAVEVKDKQAHVLLGPTVNTQRAPLAGRNFECFSEDPFLASRMAVSYIRGLQEEGVGACVKHYVCNDQEYERFSISAEVRERALREIYMPPFAAAVQEAGVWSVMSAYNRINGTYASEHDRLLLEILKGEWDFDGLVISDWYGTYSEEVVDSGLDLEMPGPARWMGEKAMQAVQNGEVDEEDIDDKIRRLLRTLIRTGAYQRDGRSEERSIDRPEHQELIRRVGSEAIVLLKNEGELLPVDKGKKLKVALIGANARSVSFQGGGSSQVSPHYVISPLDALSSLEGSKLDVEYALGCTVHKEIPPVEQDWLRDVEGAKGRLDVKYFDNPSLEGEPVKEMKTGSSQLSWFGEQAEFFDPSHFSVRVKGAVVVPEPGMYTFELACIGQARLWIEGEVAVDLWDHEPEESGEGIRDSLRLEFEKGQQLSVKMEYASLPGPRWRGVRIGCLPPLPDDPLGDAVALAEASGLAIVVAGLTPEWETEGSDRVDMDLPGDQNELIARVAAVNPNTIVVLNAGSPLHLPWLEDVKSVLQMWYLGQESGNALADILIGDANPSGKLPTTYPRHIRDNPAHINFPGENGKVHYGEGIFVGYRYYDQKGIEPLYPFGYGLSYTTFEYSNLGLDSARYGPGQVINVTLDISNTGDRKGQEVVQLYVRDVQSSLVRPQKELKGFTKVMLEPGETKRVTLTLDEHNLAFYDDARSEWVTEPGEFEVLVGRSAGDIRLKGKFEWVEG